MNVNVDVRIGKVTDVNKKKRLVRVKFEDTGITSGWLPVMQHYKATVKNLALELVEKAELSIMGSGQGAKKKKQVFAALRAKCPAAIRWAITDEVLDAVIEHAFDVMTAALGKKP